MSDVMIPLFDLFKNSRMLQITIFILIITIIVGLILIIINPNIIPFNVFSNIKTLSGGNKNETIFVSVASYRDAQCPITLKNIFQKAKYPERIFVGICQQNHKEDKDCSIVNYCIKENLCTEKQIRITRLDYKEAKGPTYARYLCSKLYDDETYFLQIDSHTRFIDNWDEEAITMLNQCESSKPVLTYYPLDYNDKNPGVPIICESKFEDKNDIPVFQSYILQANEKPTLIPFMAAGFFFCHGDFLDDIPFDPNLPYLFNGEEILFAVRMWTHGYDFYSPTKNLAYHYYDRKNEPKFWDDLPNYNNEVQHAIIKVLYLLGKRKRKDVQPSLLVDIDKYGLGSYRSLQEYYNFSKLDMDKKTQNNDWCSIKKYSY